MRRAELPLSPPDLRQMSFSDLPSASIDDRRLCSMESPLSWADRHRIRSMTQDAETLRAELAATRAEAANLRLSAKCEVNQMHQEVIDRQRESEIEYASWRRKHGKEANAIEARLTSAVKHEEEFEKHEVHLQKRVNDLSKEQDQVEAAAKRGKAEMRQQLGEINERNEEEIASLKRKHAKEVEAKETRLKHISNFMEELVNELQEGNAKHEKRVEELVNELQEGNAKHEKRVESLNNNEIHLKKSVNALHEEREQDKVAARRSLAEIRSLAEMHQKLTEINEASEEEIVSWKRKHAEELKAKDTRFTSVVMKQEELVHDLQNTCCKQTTHVDALSNGEAHLQKRVDDLLEEHEEAQATAKRGKAALYQTLSQTITYLKRNLAEEVEAKETSLIIAMNKQEELKNELQEAYAKHAKHEDALNNSEVHLQFERKANASLEREHAEEVEAKQEIVQGLQERQRLLHYESEHATDLFTRLTLSEEVEQVAYDEALQQASPAELREEIHGLKRDNLYFKARGSSQSLAAAKYTPAEWKAIGAVAEVTADVDVTTIGLSFFSYPPEPLLIKKVVAGEWAESAGLLPGDAILELNGTLVASLDTSSFKTMMQKRPLVLKIWRMAKRNKNKISSIRFSELACSSAFTAAQEGINSRSESNTGKDRKDRVECDRWPCWNLVLTGGAARCCPQSKGEEEACQIVSSKSLCAAQRSHHHMQ